ncbi:hypothetical protein EC991_003438 [Linnemannia zychae]|nr:hypothetical protein EC991_003438 [Linnemannia zychae]
MGEATFTSLPAVVSRLLQTPHIITPLYAFNRTNVYLLMSQQCSPLTPKSVVLRGVSMQGPVEIEIPVQILDTPGETIHQLAAKSDIAELEEGRGWITQLKDESDGQLIRLKYESRFANMVERKAVRLGVQFQVGGRWCSFVATETCKESNIPARNEVELGVQELERETTVSYHHKPAIIAGGACSAVIGGPQSSKGARIDERFALEDSEATAIVASVSEIETNSTPIGKRSSRIRFSMCADDYRPPFRCPGPGTAALPITANGFKTTTTNITSTDSGRTATVPTIHKPQITLKLSIIRYERSDANQATPSAKTGTLMFSQFEMLESAHNVRIPGSAFSYVKVAGHEENQSSLVVPGPTGAVRGAESEPRERSSKWMTDEFRWKREAGMLKHLRSDPHIANIFALYKLQPIAEYPYVSVMGPFTCTLDTYIKERRGIHTTPPSQPLTPEQASLAVKGPLTMMEIKSLTDSIASALKWCHDHHVVHLSLSPASVFLQEYYSEPNGKDGHRQSIYSNCSSRDSTITDADASTIIQNWKLWDFSNARFVGEPVDLKMDMTGYTSPEILIAARRHTQKSSSVAKSTTVAENPNQDTTVTETMSPDGVASKTTTIEASSSTENTTVIPSQDKEKLEMHMTYPMFTGAEDALVKLTSALERQEASPEGDSDDLDKTEASDKTHEQLQDQIKKIESIGDASAREVIVGLLEMRQERRLDHEEIRSLYLDLQE